MEDNKEVCKCGDFHDSGEVHTCPLQTKDRNKIRTHMPKLSPEERIKSFDEVELGLTEDLAVTEALRCLGCEVGLCVGCKICSEICPDACIIIKTEMTETGKQFVREYEIDTSICMFCGLCTEACPTKTLTHSKEYELSTFSKEEMKYILGNLLPATRKETEKGKV